MGRKRPLIYRDGESLRRGVSIMPQVLPAPPAHRREHARHLPVEWPGDRAPGDQADEVALGKARPNVGVGLGKEVLGKHGEKRYVPPMAFAPDDLK